MRRMPPSTTNATVAAIAMPIVSFTSISFSAVAPVAAARASASWLAFMMQSVPNMPATANPTANGRQLLPMARSIMCIVPPQCVPSGDVERNFTASTPSWYFVLIPTMALTHIQNTAPGPPMAIAIATPAMLPIPTVAATTDTSAWADEIPPPESAPGRRRSVRSASGSRRSDTIPDEKNSHRPPPIRVRKRG